MSDIGLSKNESARNSMLAAVHVQMGTPQSLAEIGEIKLRACGIFQTNQLDI